MVLLYKPTVFFLDKQIEYTILKSRSDKNFGKDFIDCLGRFQIKRTVKDDNSTKRSLGIG